MKIALAILTGRAEPRIEWLLDALERQAQPGDEITLIVIDHMLQHERCRCPSCEARATPSIGYRWTLPVKRLIHAPPKPCAWSGPHRITDRNWWSKSSTANTAIVLCPPDLNYIAFMDDRAMPGDRWLEAVRMNYLRRDAVLAGTYTRIESAATDIAETVVVEDHRRQRYREGVQAFKRGTWHATGVRDVGGGWLFGCTWAAPLEWLLQVNGFEEGCDSLTGEDYILGLMLANSGRRIDLSMDMSVALDRTRGNTGVRNGDGVFRGTEGKGGFASTDKGVSPNDKSHAALARFGARARTEFTPDLRELRTRWHLLNLGEKTWPMPDPDMRDWFDGQRVVEMRPPS